jgi:polygalacturonase
MMKELCWTELTNVLTGRIKFGTESNGGFKNITISNCVFDYCRGLALESVDGSIP